MASNVVTRAFQGALFLGAAAIASPSTASTIIDLAPNYVSGNCTFNTTCGPQFYSGGTFVAQRFSLSDPAKVLSGSFSAFTNSSTQPSALHWSFYSANGTGGLPGTLLFSGTSDITTRTNIGSGFGFALIRNGFDLSGVTLGAGDYYFGLQAVSDVFAVYLADANGTGAAQTYDNGATWEARGNNGANAFAVSLASGAVPEPATWAMLILGFGVVGGAMRRRQRVSVRFA